MTSPYKKKSPAPSIPEFTAKSNWPHGSTYQSQTSSFEEFAKTNFVAGTPLKFVRKELKKPILVYTPEKEKQDVLKVWRVLIRYMGDIVDYRRNLDHDTHQPELGSVMTRLCRQLGQDQSQNPFGPAPNEPGELNLNDDGLQMLPNKPKLGTLRKLKNTIALRLFGKGRKSVFQFLPLEETLISDVDKIQYIIGYAILRPRIRDEVYCGLCRQLTGNPHKDSVDKGWVLLTLMTASFAPSQRCLASIIDFLESGPKIYTAAAKKLLEKTVAIGDRLHPPSYLEYMSVLKKTPLELDINLMDGRRLSIPVDGTTSSFDICSTIANKIGLHSHFGFHLFITNRNKISSLGGNDHILDSVAQLEQIARDYSLTEEDSAWSLYLRKEVFEPWGDLATDSVGTNLIYSQIKRGVLLQEYSFQQDEDLASFLAKVCYIEKGGTLDQQYLQEEIVARFLENELGDEIDSEQPHLDETTVRKLTEKIQAAFENLYGETTEVKPNTYNVKLDLINLARKQWSDTFSHNFDITVVIDNGDLMEGVVKICVHGSGVRLLGDDEMVVNDIGFVEVMQLAEEIDEDEIQPHSVVFRLLDGRDVVCVSQDAGDVRDMVSHLLLGLSDRSRYAVAVEQNISSSVDDLDLAAGDLLILDRWNKDEPDLGMGPGVMNARNTRTGQKGRVKETMYHVLPCLEEPGESVLNLYKDRANWETD